MDSAKSDVVRNAVIKFGHLPNLTIAKYILYNYGELFDGNLENIRCAVRYYIGEAGERKRESAHSSGKLIQKEKVVMPLTWRTVIDPYLLPTGLWGVIADTHIPFHEPVPIESMVKYLQKEDIDGILINGDLQDCAAIAFWIQSKKRDFDRELEAIIQFLDFLKQEFPRKKFVYKAGNHEYRLPRLCQQKVPDLIGVPLAAMESVLGLEERGIDFVEYNQIINAGKLPIIHGHEYRGIDRAINPARGLFLKTNSWALCSHCHSTSEHSATNIQGKLLTTWSTGCLCDLHPEYSPINYKWNWGFALVNVEDDGDFEVVNKRILPNGEVV